MQSPEGVDKMKLMVMCLSALNGMEVGRRQLLSMKLQGMGNGDESDPEYGALPVRRRNASVNFRSNAARLEMARGAALAAFHVCLNDYGKLR